MNNTLSHHGLQYSHLGYPSHIPDSAHILQSSSSHLNSHTLAPTLYNTASSSSLQQNAPHHVSGSAHQTPSLQQQLISNQLNFIHQNPTNVALQSQLSSRNLSSSNNSSMYPQSSIYMNPYMGTLSPSSHPNYQLHLGHHHPALPHPAHSVHTHMMSQTQYIAPPPGFNVPHNQTTVSYSSAGPPVPHSTSTGQVTSYCSNSGQTATAYSKSTADAVSHAYGGLVAAGGGAMVPYNPAAVYCNHTQPIAFAAAPYQAYRYGGSSGGGGGDGGNYCPPPTAHQSGAVDAALLNTLQDTHFNYINTDDSPVKLELRKQMDGLIEQLVSVTSHDHKFSFAGVRELLETSVTKQADFDGFKAAHAFDALAAYAANLVIQPWRHEYRTIKVYCGYWVHNVAEHLTNAENILHLMGYLAAKPSKNDEATSIGCYHLPDSIFDVDVVARLALDCHVACCECQMLGKLRQEFPRVTYLQLLRYRKICTGSFEETVQNLAYFLKQNPSSMSAAPPSKTTSATDTQDNCIDDDGQSTDRVDGTTSHRRHSEESLRTKQLPEESSTRSDVPLDRSDNQLARLDSHLSNYDTDTRLPSKGINSSCKSSSASETCNNWSPKKALLPTPVNNNNSSEQALVARIMSSQQANRPSRGANTSLPSTPTSATNSLLDTIPLPITDNTYDTGGHSSSYNTSDKNPPYNTSTTANNENNYSNSYSGKHSSKRDRHSSKTYDKPERSSLDKQHERHLCDDALGLVQQSRLLLEELDHFDSSSRDPKPAHRYREGLNRRTDDSHGSVATAKLIDHEEHRNNAGHNNSSSGGGGSLHRHKESLNYLPKVLPHLRSSKHGSSSFRVSGLQETGGIMAPVETAADSCCSLPRNIPIEVFEDGTFEEHMAESYNLIKKHKLENSGRKLPNVPSYKESWGYVMQDLEKKGYSKDVGNRGDILHHLSNSRSGTSNMATNLDTTLTNSAPNAATVIPKGDIVPELISSTVQNVKKDILGELSCNKGINIVEALEQMELNDHPGPRGRSAVAHQSTSAGSSDSTARNRSKPDDYYNDKQTRYSSNDKYSSEATTDKRNSVYDNVSCGGFETAQQDTDEEEDNSFKRKKLKEGATYSQVLISGGVGGKYYGRGGNGSEDTGHEPLIPSSILSNSSNSTNSSSKYINASDATLAHSKGGGSFGGTNNRSSRRSPLGSLSKHSRDHSKNNAEYKSRSEYGVGVSNTLSTQEDKSDDSSGGAGSTKLVPWSCVFCTFCNEKNSSVCEMCSRSRQMPGKEGIKPLVAGGQQCEQCTLINDKDAATCSACGILLESCPTYI